MDKIVVGFVGGNTNLDRAIKYFSDSEEYDITHAFTMILNSTCESRGSELPTAYALMGVEAGTS